MPAPRHRHPLQLLALGTTDFEIARIKALHRTLAEVSDSVRVLCQGSLSLSLFGFAGRRVHPPGATVIPARGARARRDASLDDHVVRHASRSPHAPA